MIYDIRHVTTYSYESPVSFARCSLRLEPRSGDGQELISHAVDIKPRPADRTIRRDFFETHTESILIEAPHRNLRIDSRSRVSVSRRAPGRAAQSPAWENVRDVAFEATSLGPESPIGYVFASPLVPVLRPVTEYASASFPPAAGVIAGAVDLMHRIRTEFKYDPKATVISTPLREVFEKRHGVCQDFAHVMIACLRSRGLAARYVSGYLRVYPAPRQQGPTATGLKAPATLPEPEAALIGGGASHAWVAVYSPPFGWIELDPTNDCWVGVEHVAVAWGRDFGDVSPLRGIILGGGSHELSVNVTVEPLGAAV